MSADLARQAVSSPHWRWMAGMRTVNRFRVGDCGPRSLPPLHALPDLTDPATLGCLLALVREAWRAPKAYCMWSAMIGAWVVNVGDQHDPIESYVSEAAALVAALLAAP